MDDGLVKSLYDLRGAVLDAKKIEMMRQKENVFLNDELFLEETTKVLIRYLDALDKENYSRDILESLESNLTEASKDYFSQYEDRAARGKLFGRLNKGFYTMTNNKLVTYIRKNTGSCGTKNRLINYMPDEVLNYRIVLLHIVSIYNSRARMIGTDYSNMERKMVLLGHAARELYMFNYNVSPEDSLVNEKSLVRER